jgi:predicted enzyme related to lactoylglutathione lyase
MNEGITTIIYPVTELATAKTLFTALLGVEPATDTPYYVGFTVGGQDIGLDPNGHRKGQTGPLAYYHVADIAGSLKRLLDSGATARQEPTDVGGGKLIATVTDADGNPIGLIQNP